MLQTLASYGITPNQITASAIILSLFGGSIIWASKSYPHLLLTVPILLLIRMALNALDGLLAREYNQASPLGEISNEVGDVVSDMALYLPLLNLFNFSQTTILLIAMFITLACLTEFCGILSKTMTGIRRYDGPMGKSDRAFCIGVLAITFYFSPSMLFKTSTIIFLILDSLLMISCMNRIQYILISQKGLNK
jgi:CDP-diacylglycerol--glycerol-3-phosphate 3-phosphatidyltransferase